MFTATQSTPLLAPPAPAYRQDNKLSVLMQYWKLNRLHKFPAGSILVFWPCAWALTMAGYRTQQGITEYGWELVLCAALCTLLHSAACILSDVFDRDFDRQERTKNRPIASGAISTRGAVACLLVEVGILLAVLTYARNFCIFVIGIFDLAVLQILYPLMKRVTYWPQAWLGLAMGWGYVLVWVLRVGQHDLGIPVIFLLGTVCWAIVYDTIYGCQDRADDATAGVKSTSLLFGDHIRHILPLFAIGFLAAVSVAGYLNQQGLWYYIISIGAPTLHFTWQITTLRENDPQDCWKKFESNGTLGFIVFIGMLIDYLQKCGLNPIGRLVIFLQTVGEAESD